MILLRVPYEFIPPFAQADGGINSGVCTLSLSPSRSCGEHLHRGQVAERKIREYKQIVPEINFRSLYVSYNVIYDQILGRQGDESLWAQKGDREKPWQHLLEQSLRAR